MKYCKNCGHSLREGARFCPECGVSMQAEGSPKLNESEQLSEQNKPEQLSGKNELEQPLRINESQPLSRKNNAKQQSSQAVASTPKVRQSSEKKPAIKRKRSKILGLIIVILGIILFGSYYTINKMIMSPEAVTSRFMEAVKEKDATQVRRYINDGQLEMDASNTDTKAFLTFLDDRPQMITAMSDQLQHDVQMYLDHPDYMNVASAAEDMSLASLKKDGKKWLLFDHYVVNIKPVYIEVTSTEDETAIFVGGKEVGTVGGEKEKKFGPFLPGIYNVKAVIDGDYGKVENVQEVDFSEKDEEGVSPAFDFSSNYVELYSDNNDAILYVNGKSTKKKIGDIGIFGPVPKDDSIELFARKEFSTGVKKSDTTIIGKDTDNAGLYLDYDDYDEEYALAQAEEAEQEAFDDEAYEVSETINDHYLRISNDDFESAYSLFSSGMQSKFGVDGWASGLADNISDDVTAMEIERIDDDAAKAYIEMTSYDNQDDDSILVQEWEGYWTLVKENGKWKLDKSDLEKVDSWTE
ncbi:zinc-ribbon domain-containing protein [Lentibacillus sp. N15]|uniref:TcaA 3rd/4th domain-containing protein n=1 Tax=Lentibacillus songyuanensis TaxID=3136161 RepID=UPI0031B9FD20